MATLSSQNQDSLPPPRWRRLVDWIVGWSDRRQRRAVEDLLKHVHAYEQRGQAASAESVAGAIGWSTHRAVKVIASVEANGYLRSTARGLALTSDGKQLAVNVIRAHRLWERYLADEAGMPLTRVHAEANRREHHRDGGMVDRLDAALGYPQSDPHGDPIPRADGKLADFTGTPLMSWPTGTAARIRHLEDEPASVFDQIAATGLLPGQTIIVEGSTAEGLRVLFDGRKSVLPPVIAANVFVEALPRDEAVSIDIQRLSSLEHGKDAVILGLDHSLRGFHRRRLQDLGLTPGTPIRAERVSMFRDPKAYRVRGSLVALRREQADKVHIEEEPARSNAESGAAS
jgi:DtxR family transcriptional regulator, Mn-dependent transcriptional regulator